MPTDEEQLEALRTWRRWHQLKGAVPAQLPNDEELRRLVNTRARTVADVQRPRLTRDAKRFVAAHADEVLMALGVLPVDAEPVADEPESDPAEPPPPVAPAGRSVDAPAPPVVDPASLVFAPYAWGEADRTAVAASVVVAPEDGTVTLMWPEVPGPGVTVYRVFGSETGQPYDPDDQLGPLAVTTEPSVTDSAEGGAALRYYAIWANTGPDLASAARRQPVLHATATAVLPVRSPSIRADGQVVLGTWRTGAGAARVEVLRLPAATAATAGYDPVRYGVARESSNLTGFRDGDVVPGERYVYRATVIADVGGTLHRSRPFSQPVEVRASLRAVDDLTAEERVDAYGNSLVTLRWTRPRLGEVRLYRTRHAPAPGAREATDLRVDALEQTRLDEESLIPFPVEDLADGGQVMRDVTWPDDWSRIWFTPVVVHGESAVVGRAATLIRPAPVREPVLHERVSWQHLTFGWPDGATLVKVFLTREDEQLVPDDAGLPLAEITEKDYIENGGLRLTGRAAIRTTSPYPSSLHLVSVMFAEGLPYTSHPVTLTYRGVLQVHYRITAAKTGIFKGPASAKLEVRANLPVPQPLGLRLVHSPDRLPLSVGENVTQIRFVETPLSSDTWAEVELPHLPVGYVRLFVDTPPRFPMRIAVLDPPLQQLRIDR